MRGFAALLLSFVLAPAWAVNFELDESFTPARVQSLSDQAADTSLSAKDREKALAELVKIHGNLLASELNGAGSSEEKDRREALSKTFAEQRAPLRKLLQDDALRSVRIRSSLFSLLSPANDWSVQDWENLLRDYTDLNEVGAYLFPAKGQRSVYFYNMVPNEISRSENAVGYYRRWYELIGKTIAKANSSEELYQPSSHLERYANQSEGELKKYTEELNRFFEGHREEKNLRGAIQNNLKPLLNWAEKGLARHSSLALLREHGDELRTLALSKLNTATAANSETTKFVGESLGQLASANWDEATRNEWKSKLSKLLKDFPESELELGKICGQPFLKVIEETAKILKYPIVSEVIDQNWQSLGPKAAERQRCLLEHVVENFPLTTTEETKLFDFFLKDKIGGRSLARVPGKEAWQEDVKEILLQHASSHPTEADKEIARKFVPVLDLSRKNFSDLLDRSGPLRHKSRRLLEALGERFRSKESLGEKDLRRDEVFSLWLESWKKTTPDVQPAKDLAAIVGYFAPDSLPPNVASEIEDEAFRVLKDEKASASERQEILEIFASQQNLFSRTVQRDPSLAKRLLRPPFRAPLKAFGAKDVSMISAGIRMENLVDEKEIEKKPLCARICDLASALARKRYEHMVTFSTQGSDTNGWYLAQEALRFHFISRARSLCPDNSNTRNYIEETRKVLGHSEKGAVRKFFDGLFGESSSESDWPRFESGAKPPAAVKVEKQIFSGTVTNSAMPAYFTMYLSPVGVKEKLFTPKTQNTMDRALLDSLNTDFSSIRACGIRDSLYNTYAYAAAYLHVAQTSSTLPSSARVRENLLRMVKRAEKTGDPLRIPYYMNAGMSCKEADKKSADVDAPAGESARASYGRNVVVYLALFKSARDEKERAQFRARLNDAVAFYLKNVPDAILLSRHTGAHMGEDNWAPYFFFATLPYLTQAMQELKAGSAPEEKERLEVGESLLGKVLLSHFDARGLYTSAREGENDNAVVYHNALMGMALYHLGEKSCRDGGAIPSSNKTH